MCAQAQRRFQSYHKYKEVFVLWCSCKQRKKLHTFTRRMRAINNWYSQRWQFIKIREHSASPIADWALQPKTLTRTHTSSDRSMLKFKETDRDQWVEHEIVIYTNATHIVFGWLISQVGILIKPVLQLLLLSMVCWCTVTRHRCTKFVYKLNSFGLRWVLGSQCE